jgi:hypothetical protein
MGMEGNSVSVPSLGFSPAFFVIPPRGGRFNNYHSSPFASMLNRNTSMSYATPFTSFAPFQGPNFAAMLCPHSTG